MICYSDLKIDTNRERPYCHGQQACVNMSGIFSTLMKEAGKCESYFEREDFDDLDWINVWFKKVV
mgnify:CR=1 FL=1|uniref:Uncharacterized protein n=1 Tax=Siphoviridae sp. ct96x5 TaxID=2825367 RepID=A0A8S5PR83_9CAUD|nr:MAG TPA: hypothetical protein [Siphoviridae sp. ct96x5]